MGFLAKELLLPGKIVRHDSDIFLSDPPDSFFKCFHDNAISAA
jgi:hypothetical protein